MYLLKLCRGGAYTSIPEKYQALNLDECSLKLISHGYKVTNAKVMLLVRTPTGIELSVYKSGKILIRCADNARARAEIDEVYKIIRNR